MQQQDRQPARLAIARERHLAVAAANLKWAKDSIVH
jgi:hypothetical protein